MIYTIVDEGYNITVSKTQKRLAILLDGFFLEDGTPVSERTVSRQLSKNTVFYVYSSDETRHWSEEWHYRVECHK
jgi:hypothetical protein